MLCDGLMASTSAALEPAHVLSWWAGWSLLLASFVAGAWIGLHHHREGFLGGYGTFRRRMVRLGHISMAALGIVNVLFALSPWPPIGTWQADLGGLLFVLGGVLMPTVCFLSAWRQPLRHLFALPVSALLAAVVLTLLGGGAR